MEGLSIEGRGAARRFAVSANAVMVNAVSAKAVPPMEPDPVPENVKVIGAAVARAEKKQLIKVNFRCFNTGGRIPRATA